MKTEPTTQTTSASALATTPSNPPSSQTHHRGTQTVPAIPAMAASSPKPRLTRLEQLKQFDATLRLYSPVVGSILEILFPWIFCGIVILLFVVFLVIMPLLVVLGYFSD
jgi:hypothetical protein